MSYGRESAIMNKVMYGNSVAVLKMKMKCKGCNSELQAFEYQSRSADEAHSKSYKCPYCPLNIDKFYNTRPIPHLYLSKKTPKIPRTKSTTFYNELISTFVYVETKDIDAWKEYERFPARASNYLDSNSRSFKSYSSGPWKGKSMMYKDKKQIALNAWLTSIITAETDADPDKEYIDFQYILVEDWIGMLTNTKIVFIHQVPDSDDNSVLHLLYDAYLKGIHPRTLSGSVDKVLLGLLSNLTARAYDSNITNDESYLYTTKPDGERMWIVRTGSIWLYVRRLLNFQIESFEIGTQLHFMDNYNIGPIIDAEIMLVHPPILIDILADEYGIPSSYERNIMWINEDFERLSINIPYLKSIHTRPFFNTFDEAELYSKDVLYPTDGIVAISKHGTDMKKLKNLRSIELQLLSDNILATKENSPLFRITAPHVYSVGDIIEIRFTVVDGQLKISEWFIRPDKKTANDNAAIDSIILSSISELSSSMIRTSIWRWSNKLRASIYKRAHSINKQKNIILDIGSGSGQSSEAFRELSDCSFILIEPDESKCKSLCKRLGVRTYHNNPRSVIPVVSQLKTGSRKYHILNMTLQTVLEDKPTMKNLVDILRCAVACFSTHYIGQSLEVFESHSIPFIGCYYSYDNIAVGESIIDTVHIRMSRTTYHEALVKWGMDTPYTEPVLLQDDIPIGMSCISASSMVNINQFIRQQDIFNACSSVKVLIYL